MSNGQIPPKATGLLRLYKAFFYSLAGIRATFRSEAAFRQEVIVLPISTLVAWLLPLPLAWSLWLTFGAVFLILMELVNTAIERIIDLVSPNFHPLAKEAKDIGSAIVLTALIFYTTLWALALYLQYSPKL